MQKCLYSEGNMHFTMLNVPLRLLLRNKHKKKNPKTYKQPFPPHFFFFNSISTNFKIISQEMKRS